MDIKDKLKERRLSLGLSLKDVAESVGVSEGTVSRWESGQIEDMKRSRIYMLSKTLKISPLVIMGMEEELPSGNFAISASEKHILENYRQLNDEGQEKVQSYISDLLRAGIYKKGHSESFVDSKNA